MKYSIGKLQLENISPEELPAVSKEAGFETLILSEEDVSSFHKLPRQSHKDPFDRLIVWQAINNHFTLLSKDKSFSIYEECGLKTTW